MYLDRYESVFAFKKILVCKKRLQIMKNQYGVRHILGMCLLLVAISSVYSRLKQDRTKDARH